MAEDQTSNSMSVPENGNAQPDGTQSTNAISTEAPMGSGETTTAMAPTVGLLAEVTEGINSSTARVKDMLVSRLVDAEVNARVDLLNKALDKFKQLKTDLKKVNKPDIESFNADGTVASSSFTKAKLEEVKKATDKLNKLEKALNDFLGEVPGAFAKLKEEANK